jgi:hypothetical protein
VLLNIKLWLKGRQLGANAAFAPLVQVRLLSFGYWFNFVKIGIIFIIAK